MHLRTWLATALSLVATSIAASATGTISIPFVMPPGVPAGTELWVQRAISDAAAISGLALSNALKGTTP